MPRSGTFLALSRVACSKYHRTTRTNKGLCEEPALSAVKKPCLKAFIAASLSVVSVQPPRVYWPGVPLAPSRSNDLFQFYIKRCLVIFIVAFLGIRKVSNRPLRPLSEPCMPKTFFKLHAWWETGGWQNVYRKKALDSTLGFRFPEKPNTVLAAYLTTRIHKKRAPVASFILLNPPKPTARPGHLQPTSTHNSYLLKPFTEITEDDLRYRTGPSEEEKYGSGIGKTLLFESGKYDQTKKADSSDAAPWAWHNTGIIPFRDPPLRRELPENPLSCHQS